MDKNIKNYVNCKDNEKFYNKNFDFLKAHFIEAKNEIARIYPEAKFVIIKYPSGPKPKQWFITTERWKELEKEGIIIIDAEKLTGVDLSDEKYLLFDKHPSEKAWDKIIPKLSARLNLQR